MADRPFEYRDIYLRTPRKKSKPPVAKRPRMPRPLWWTWAVVLFGAGALLTWTIVDDTDVAVLRIIAGGLGFVVVGMLIVETIWERRRKRNDPPDGPIVT